MPKSPKRRAAGAADRSQSSTFAVVIMAAGKGTRLKSRHPKVLHEVGGKPLLAHVVSAATKVVPAKDVYAIVGHEAERVKQAMQGSGIGFILQAEQHGTGHALIVSKNVLAGYDHVIVLSGDAPLISAATIKKLRDQHLQERAAMTILTAVLDRPYGYGRIIYKQGSKQVQAIVEEKALTAKQKSLKEINSGFYAFAVKPLFQHIGKLSTNNAHREYYLTDMAAILAGAKQKVVSVKTEDAHEVLGCNIRLDLSDVDAELRRRKCIELMVEGVTIYRPETCVIDSDVTVGADTIIEPFVQLLGKTRIGEESRIRSYSVINNSEIGDRVLVRPGTIMDEAHVGSDAIIGPYSHLRPASEIGEGAHVGNFVETKKVRLGKGSKANHLTYLGDAQIGDGVNVGAGTITCNYDGVHKHETIIEDGAFIGSDATLVAPVRIGKGAYVGAASCVTDDVPDEALAIGRARQVTKPDWVRERRKSRAAGEKH